MLKSAEKTFVFISILEENERKKHWLTFSVQICVAIILKKSKVNFIKLISS